MSEFGLTLPEILDLTPRQIEDVYFHARDKEGAIKPPSATAPTRTHEEGLLAVLALAGTLSLKPEAVAEIKRRLEEHRGKSSRTS